MRRKLLIVSLFIFVLILSSVGLYWLLSGDTTTYKGDGFQISYPKDFKETDGIETKYLNTKPLLTVGKNDPFGAVVVIYVDLGVNPPRTIEDYIVLMDRRMYGGEDREARKITELPDSINHTSNEAMVFWAIGPNHQQKSQGWLEFHRLIFINGGLWHIIRLYGYESYPSYPPQVFPVLESFKLIDNTNWFDWKWIIGMTITIIGITITIIKKRNKERRKRMPDSVRSGKEGE
jgi:hypothetical protein